MNKNKLPNVPVTLSHELHRDIRKASKETNLSRADVMRQSIRIGLPKLRAAFQKLDAPALATAK
ncbi:MAG: hypothetical protein MUF81_04015 [Verrucomicrobia bacterium]|jgi:hypothetical protein|nr:hypothetical protein [Verrucomicrobiota bacterium]